MIIDPNNMAVAAARQAQLQAQIEMEFRAAAKDIFLQRLKTAEQEGDPAQLPKLEWVRQQAAFSATSAAVLYEAFGLMKLDIKDDPNGSA